MMMSTLFAESLKRILRQDLQTLFESENSDFLSFHQKFQTFTKRLDRYKQKICQLLSVRFRLPNVALIHIFSFLDWGDFASVKLVCATWFNLSKKKICRTVLKPYHRLIKINKKFRNLDQTFITSPHFLVIPWTNYPCIMDTKGQMDFQDWGDITVDTKQKSLTIAAWNSTHMICEVANNRLLCTVSCKPWRLTQTRRFSENLYCLDDTTFYRLVRNCYHLDVYNLIVENLKECKTTFFFLDSITDPISQVYVDNEYLYLFGSVIGSNKVKIYFFNKFTFRQVRELSVRSHFTDSLSLAECCVRDNHIFFSGTCNNKRKVLQVSSFSTEYGIKTTSHISVELHMKATFWRHSVLIYDCKEKDLFLIYDKYFDKKKVISRFRSHCQELSANWFL